MSSASHLDDNLADLSDEQLVARARDRGGRDERPFAELFRRHSGMVWRLSIGFLGSAQDAEDMTQDVFFTAHRKLAQFKGEASFRTWLHRIASNRCKNELRRRSRRLRTVDEPLEEAAATATNGSPGPEAVMVRGRGLQRLARAMESLAPEDRGLLQLVELEHTPYRELAAAMGLSLGAVKMRVLRVRARLREAFSADEKRKDR